MRFFITILSAVYVLALAHPAFAGAWTQGTGNGLAILTASYYATDHYWDTNGHKHSQPAYTQYALAPYAEYGLTDGLTIGGGTSLQRVHQQAWPALPSQDNWGLGDSEIFVRQRLWQSHGFVVSAQPMIKLPSPESSDALPRLGGSSFDAGLGLSVGYGFNAYGRHHFLNLDTQYRHRFGSPKDQVNLAATAGIGLNERWMLMPQAFLTYRTSTPAQAAFTESSGDDYNLAKLQLSAVYKINNRVALQAGAFANVSGRNTGGGGGALLAVWMYF